jgi:RimJ/RimL family protein N-acetyltransferase
MISIEKHDRQTYSKFFQGFKWNYLPDAILEGNMGEVMVDSTVDPQVVVLGLPKLMLFIPGGDPGHAAAREYMYKPPKVSAFIFQSKEWECLMKEIHAGKFVPMQRHAFTSEKLDAEHLRKLASNIPHGYQLKQMDLNLAKQLASERSEFASAHLVNFDSPEDFIARGFGFCILAGEEIVCAGTTFVFCSKGIEIQISTREKQRRKGLATVIAAQLLTYCLQNNLDPNWDAENEKSSNLAKKLGYTPQGNYPMWLVVDSRSKASFIRLMLKIKEFFKQ